MFAVLPENEAQVPLRLLTAFKMLAQSAVLV